MKRAELLYRSRCAKCRLLSALVVFASFGLVRRIPLESAEARRLAAQWGIERGKLALLVGHRLLLGGGSRRKPVAEVFAPSRPN